MTHVRVFFLALTLGATPLAAALPATAAPAFEDQRRPDRERGDDRERGRDEQRGRSPSISAGDAARRVSSGREGRMLGIRSQGDGYVVRWEYPGGRVADIRVDGSGRISGG